MSEQSAVPLVAPPPSHDASDGVISEAVRRSARTRLSGFCFLAAVLLAQVSWLGVLAYLAVRFF